MKKIAIVGNGTAGILAATHFSKWADNCEIELYYDPKIKPQSVGEGSTLQLPINLYESINFKYENLEEIDGSFKCGIRKIGWNGSGDFMHHFSPPAVSYHFNAVKLQKYLLEKIRHKIRIVEGNVIPDQIDSDFIMDCSGTPKNFDDFYISEHIPVNSVYVTQCFWDGPKFQHTLTIARPYGWVFGIPLQNRCSIGYMYNNTINTLEEVKQDVLDIFRDFNLIPSTYTNNFSFRNYFRKKNYTERVVYNGNASFFLEPMEATSIYTMDFIQRTSFDLWFNNHSIEQKNVQYNKLLNDIENMIAMHYFCGSIYKNSFWDFANDRGKNCMNKALKDSDFVSMLNDVKNNTNSGPREYGTWPVESFRENLYNLDFFNIFEKYKSERGIVNFEQCVNVPTII